MAIDSKVDLLRGIEKVLADVATVAVLSRTVQSIADLLDAYDITLRKTDGSAEDYCLDSFLSAMSVGGRSEETIKRYRYEITRLNKFVMVPTRRITVYHLRSYLAAEKERGISDRTLHGVSQVFSTYFNWLHREELIDRNPVANLGPVKYAKKERKAYSEVDMALLASNCVTTRDKAIVSFLSSTGCRVGEMVRLNRDSVDLSRLECVVRGKGNKERTVYLGPVAAMHISAYLAERKDDCEALFVNCHKKRLKQGGVRYMLNVLAKRACVENVHPHRFRRTLATDLCRHGMPIQEVASVLGHDKIDTTMKYVVLDKDDVKASYRRYA